jgi:hypothetical protein
MIDEEKHIVAATEAIDIFQRRCGAERAHVIADLICDLGHVATARDIDFLDEVKRALRHWYAETCPSASGQRARDAIVEIRLTPK